MQLVSWLLVGFGAYVLIASIYRLGLSLKALAKQTDLAKLALNQFSVTDEPYPRAFPTTSEQLPKLLRDQSSRRRDKAHAAEVRQRRLIDRISSMEIDKRSA